MAKPTQIRSNRTPTFRRHYLKEWLEERGMDPMELLDALNDAATMESPPMDKSQVYRWLKGQLPQRATQVRIAAALRLYDPETGDPDPEMIMTNPMTDWIAQRVKSLPKEDLDDVKEMLDLWLKRR